MDDLKYKSIVVGLEPSHELKVGVCAIDCDSVFADNEIDSFRFKKTLANHAG